MNYYERHLGDYAKQTGHLSMLQHGAYTLLLDRYYGSEKGIPAAKIYAVAKAGTKPERAAVDSVLEEFFELVDGLWIKNRCEEELERARLRVETARQNGRHGGRPRKHEQKPSGFSGGGNTETKNEPNGLSPEKPGGLFLGSENTTQQKALQSPVSSLHIPSRKREEEARAARLPTDWALTGDRKSIAEAEHLDPDRTFAKFTDHWRAASGANARKRDWDAAWRNWCRNETDRKPMNGKGLHTQSTPVKYQTADEIETIERARGDWDA